MRIGTSISQCLLVSVHAKARSLTSILQTYVCSLTLATATATVSRKPANSPLNKTAQYVAPQDTGVGVAPEPASRRIICHRLGVFTVVDTTTARPTVVASAATATR